MLCQGYRERLHGHNYKVDLQIWGRRGDDGYVVDFGKMKATLRALCKEINEHVILPANSDVLDISDADNGTNIVVKCEDGSVFRYVTSAFLKPSDSRWSFHGFVSAFPKGIVSCCPSFIPQRKSSLNI